MADARDALPLLKSIAGLTDPVLSDSCYLEPRPGELFAFWHRWGRTDHDCNQYTDMSDVLVLLRFVAGIPLGLHRFCQPSWPA